MAKAKAKTPKVEKAKATAPALAVGTETVYLGGSRSEKLRKGQAITIGAVGPNKDGTWRYNVRFKDSKGKSFTTWLGGQYVKGGR